MDRFEMVEKMSRYRAQYETWVEPSIVHANDHGVTLCGKQVGGEERGWFAVPLGYRHEYIVSCKPCLAKIRLDIENRAV
jgi:hypothetical protein